MQEIFILDLKEKVEKAKRVCVFGGGSTGMSLLQFFEKKKLETFLLDSKPQNLKIPCFLDSEDISSLPSFDLLIKSPGISPEHKILSQCKEKNIPILSEISLARMYSQGKVLGITGTDGKSTTTALTHHILSDSYPKTAMGGNIGIPYIDFCEESLDIAVLELSSYQLEDSHSLNLDASAYLNLANDHLERHKTMENYHRAKCKIASFGDKNHVFVVNEKLVSTLPMETIQCTVLTFGIQDRCSAKILENQKKILTSKHSYNYEGFPLLGMHNLENLSASILLSESMGCDPIKIENSFKNFQGLNYRFQEIHTYEYAKFINDSKSTNLHSLLSGIKGFRKQDSLVLILGGRPKQEPIQPLLDRLKELSPKCIYIYGEARDIWIDMVEMQNVIHVDTPIHALENLKYGWKSMSPSYVIFSPACASFDQYKNFEERGKIFTEAVRSIF